MQATDQFGFDDQQLDEIAELLSNQGYLILEQALPESLLTALHQQANTFDQQHWQSAGVGRSSQFQVDKTIRSDSIHWIEGSTPCESDFLNVMDSLRVGLNRRLFMGLFDYESHFAVYHSGEFYQKHIDALKGRSNRVLSTVLYLNQDWQAEHGGELVIYNKTDSSMIDKVSPKAGTLAIFLSEDFPHEVLPAQHTRYSIAGWFRVNNNQNGQLDPAN